jgi:hypothetical protein
LVDVLPDVVELPGRCEGGDRRQIVVDSHDLSSKIATSLAQLTKQEPFSPGKIPADSDPLADYPIGIGARPRFGIASSRITRPAPPASHLAYGPLAYQDALAAAAEQSVVGRGSRGFLLKLGHGRHGRDKFRLGHRSGDRTISD